MVALTKAVYADIVIRLVVSTCLTGIEVEGVLINILLSQENPVREYFDEDFEHNLVVGSRVQNKLH